MRYSSIKDACEIIFIGNPLSMFIFNLFAPARCAEFAHQTKYYPLMWESYLFLAMLMPYYWLKYWIAWEEPKNLKDYRTKTQVKYFLEFCYAETAQHLSDAAFDKIWNACIENTGFALYASFDNEKCLSILVAGRKKLNEKQLEQLLNGAGYNIIRQYFGYGAMPKPQVMQMIRFCCAKGDCASVCLLADYIRRYGADAEMITLAFEYKEHANLIQDELTEALDCHSQRVFIDKHGASNALPEFETYCFKHEKFFAEAQMHMNKDQYDIFHKTGHKLSPEAIEYFVAKHSIPMCRRIFKYEENNGLANEKINAMIHADAEMCNLFYMVIDHVARGLE